MWIDSTAGGIGGSSPGDMIVQIFAVDASGFPTGAALAQGSVAAANFTTSAALSWRDVNVSPAVMVSAGTKYALVMTSSQTAGTPPQEYRYMWAVASRDAYSRGTAMFKFGTQWFSNEQDDYTFKTFVDVPDTEAPRVTGVTPTGTGVALGANLSATFSEEMNKSTLTKSTFKLFKVIRNADGSTTLQQITNVGVTPSGDGFSAKLDPYPSDPSKLLAANTKYKAIVTKGAKDLAGNSLSQSKSWTFTTR
jgi:hypothetical protein